MFRFGLQEGAVRAVLRLGTPEVELVLYRRLSECRGERGWGEVSLCWAPRKLLVSDGGDSWGLFVREWLRERAWELSLATVGGAE